MRLSSKALLLVNEPELVGSGIRYRGSGSDARCVGTPISVLVKLNEPNSSLRDAALEKLKAKAG